MTENERIKEVRIALRKTQKDFGTAIGVTNATVSAVETGINAVSDQLRKSICREFNVSEEWLRTGDGEMFIQLNEEDELMEWAGRVLASRPEDFRRRFVKMLMSLSIDDWKILEAKVKELAGMDGGEE